MQIFFYKKRPPKLVRQPLGDFQISEQKLSLRVDNDENLWGLMPRISFVCHAVGRDLFRIKSINIDPYIAREACDIVEPNRMASNGRYLANALYAISRNKELFDEINSILNDSLTSKGIIKPEVSNILLKRFFTLVSEDAIQIPSNCLSDGTIKLIGLLVGIINQEHYTMIIEEPENYLHPRVDRLIIDFLRETFEDGVCILTSHSETILNLLDPRELIICTNKSGRTFYKRLENAQRVLESIVDSGFGCGYHYVAGNLSELQSVRLNMELSKIAIYVDGPTEEGALTAWFHKYYYSKPKFRYGPGNGVDYSLKGYAKNVAPKVVQNLKSMIHQIIFIPDFEKRQQKYNELI